ncbi:hypothetical protein B0H14DRAFT_3455487 [Mycena olivaceomarginata]|nr:hypothetical protein B0H14DRAFT_3455487 [Mycena olivaceomarginata]
MSKIFGNETAPAVDPSEYCDVCNAGLFDRARPSKPLPAVRQQAAKKGLVVPAIRLALYEWRSNIKKSRYSHTAFSSQAILDDDTCERLASVGPIPSKDLLQQHLSGWARWEALGDSLFSLVQTLDIPPLQLAAKRPRASTSQESEPVATTAKPTIIISSLGVLAHSNKRSRGTIYANG